MTGLVFDLLLCSLIFGVALAAVAGRDLFGSIAFFVVFGVLIALAWTRLDAVDVALAEAAIGAGLTGMLLIGARARVARLAAEEREPEATPGSRLGDALAALACGGVVAAVCVAVFALDPAGEGLAGPVADNLSASGVGNPVTAVLLVFRGYDTLLECMVLLVALVGVWSMSVDRDWSGLPGLRQHVRPGGVLATFGRLLPPVGLLVGVYLVWAGAERPGGAFQGATVLAAVWLLVAMAGVVEAPRVGSAALRLALIAGPGVFLAFGAVSAVAGTFLGLPESLAGSLVLGLEAALTLSIAVTLALLVVGAPQRRAP